MRTRTFLPTPHAAAVLLLVLGLLTFLSGCRDTIIQQVASSTSLTAQPAASDTATSETTPSTEAAFVQGEGEIFLEAIGKAGPESFTGETFVPVGPPSTLNIPTSTTLLPPLPSTTPGAQTRLASYSGDTPALYGGSKSRALADKEGQLRFFEQNPAKAAAFCAALNSDPTFRWSGGTQIQPSQLRDYFAELTPVMLTRDTRVTNYGYRDGRPTPRQSVLQAGQMVLVDRWGVPRVRCECGNPLTPPQPVPVTPRYTGPRWPDFDPTVIIVIQQTTVIIDEFILIDIYTGDSFDRPAGTEGAKDVPHEATKWQLDVEMKWQITSERIRTISWKTEITVNPDGTLSGFGEGIWHGVGITYQEQDSTQTQTGTWVGDASFAVSISGTVETTDLGRTLKIQPTMGDLAIENLEFDTTSNLEEVDADVRGKIPGWVQEAFTEFDLPAQAGPVYASVAASGYEGSATLAPLR